MTPIHSATAAAGPAMLPDRKEEDIFTLIERAKTNPDAERQVLVLLRARIQKPDRASEDHWKFLLQRSGDGLFPIQLAYNHQLRDLTNFFLWAHLCHHFKNIKIEEGDIQESAINLRDTYTDQLEDLWSSTLKWNRIKADSCLQCEVKTDRHQFYFNFPANKDARCYAWCLILNPTVSEPPRTIGEPRFHKTAIVGPHLDTRSSDAVVISPNDPGWEQLTHINGYPLQPKGEMRKTWHFEGLGQFGADSTIYGCCSFLEELERSRETLEKVRQETGVTFDDIYDFLCFATATEGSGVCYYRGKRYNIDQEFSTGPTASLNNSPIFGDDKQWSGDCIVEGPNGHIMRLSLGASQIFGLGGFQEALHVQSYHINVWEIAQMLTTPVPEEPEACFINKFQKYPEGEIIQILKGIPKKDLATSPLGRPTKTGKTLLGFLAQQGFGKALAEAARLFPHLGFYRDEFNLKPIDYVSDSDLVEFFGVEISRLINSPLDLLAYLGPEAFQERCHYAGMRLNPAEYTRELCAKIFYKMVDRELKCANSKQEKIILEKAKALIEFFPALSQLSRGEADALECLVLIWGGYTQDFGHMIKAIDLMQKMMNARMLPRNGDRNLLHILATHSLILGSDCQSGSLSLGLFVHYLKQEETKEWLATPDREGNRPLDLAAENGNIHFFRIALSDPELKPLVTKWLQNKNHLGKMPIETMQERLKLLRDNLRPGEKEPHPKLTKIYENTIALLQTALQA